MPTLNINGQSVNVDDSFMGMSPAEQENTVDEISKSMGVHLGGANTSITADLAKAIPAKVAEGATADVLGQAGNTQAALGGARQWVNDKLQQYLPSTYKGLSALYDADKAAGGQNYTNILDTYAPLPENRVLPTSSEVEKNLGLKFYEPQTGVGQIVGGGVRAAANPASYVGPGGLLGKGISAFMSGGASEGAGLATEGTKLEPAARLIAGVAAPVAHGAVTGYRGAAPTVRPDGTAVSNLALDRAAQAVQDSGLTHADIDARAAQLPSNATLAEYAPSLSATAGAVANKPGAGQNILYNAANERAEGRPARVEAALTQALGAPTDVFAQNEATAAARSAASTPLYQAWRNTQVPMTPELQALAPQLQRAGITRGAHSDMGIENAAAADAALPGGRIDPNSPPSAEAWDYMKRNLDDKITTAQRAGQNNRARQYTQLRNGIVDAIDNHPDPNVAGVWQQARQAYAQPTAILDARSAGQDVFNRNLSPSEFAATWNNYSAPERAAHIEGARDALQQMLDSRNRSTAVENFLQAPANVQKLATMVGPQRANALATSMEQERSMASHENLLTGNSKTARIQAADKNMDPTPAFDALQKVIHFYNPEVAPGGFLEFTGVPGLLKNTAIARNAQVMRPDMARILSQTGPQATQTLHGLLDYHPVGHVEKAAHGALRGLLDQDQR